MSWIEAREIVDFHVDGLERTPENAAVIEAWSEVKCALYRMAEPRPLELTSGEQFVVETLRSIAPVCPKCGWAQWPGHACTDYPTITHVP